ncbi:MAG: hydroxyacid dehydrogenase [Gemmatimonadota bacterium]
MKRAAFLCDSPERLAAVYGRGRRERVAALTDLCGPVLTAGNLADHAAAAAGVEAAFSTWGMPRLTAAQLDLLPRLGAVFYAAGSVKAFAPPLLERGITVVSAWAANARPVAEFTLAQILLACKGYFANTRACRAPEVRRGGGLPTGPGVFGETVGLIGAGMVGRAVCELLRGFELKVLVCDPYLPPAEADALGVELTSLEGLFDRAYVVSNHLPNLPSLVGYLTGAHFLRLRPGATFINTGRGAQVREDELIAALRERPDLTALLDVTFPEPPEPDSELYRLPNALLSSHIAGSLNDELVRMADYVIEEFQRWEAGLDLRYRVTAEMLDRMA